MRSTPVATDTLVELSGPITRAEAPRWREVLAEARALGRNLRIDLAESGPWDLAGLQLMLAALASCERSGQDLAVVSPPQVFLAIAERAGVADRFVARRGS